MSQSLKPTSPGVVRSNSTQKPYLWKLIAYVAIGHVIAVIILSPQFYCKSSDSPEALFARGEQAMAEGKPVEAMQAFRQVLDQQPKPPAIYARAAEQHRLADRMARQAAGKAAAEAEKASIAEKTNPGTTTAPSATQPVPTKAVTPENPKPDQPFIPPELRPKSP